MIGWWLAAVAWGGAGPWVPGSGSGSLYLGADVQQYRKLATTRSGQRQSSEIGEGINQFSLAGIVSYGVAPRAEVEVVVPVHFTHADREDADLCDALGEGACDETRSVGTIQSHLKVLITDELAGAPLSVSVAGVVRFGALVAQYRDRLTNVGEGTLDGGAKLSLGKSGALGEGYWSTSMDMTGLYRVPNTQRYPLQRGDRSVPGSELHVALDSFFAPKRVVAIGPSANLLWRPSGVDFEDIDRADVDRFGALRVMQLNVGAKLVFRDTHDNAFVVGAFRTAYAVNNPSDQIGLSVGISLNQLFQKRGS
jgi:hypothetical protein